jgi:branched-subunit amino acid ABC-type transport system permease component
MKVGFIGLGRMGRGMARRVLDGGHALAVFDMVAAATAEFGAAGATVAATVADVCRERDVVITMLVEDAAVLDVALRPGGMRDSLPKGAIHLAMGTYGVATIRALEDAHAEAGQVLVAAPVLGRPDLAAAGQLGVAWTGLDDDQWAYYVVVSVAALLFLLARNGLTGRLGRALAVIRENEVVAASMGISPRRYKALAFTMAAAYGGAAGWLYVYAVGFISPLELDLLLSVSLLSVMIVGGMGSVLGSLLGGALYVYIPVVAGTVSPVRTTLLYGAILLLVLFVAPGGLARTIYRLGHRLARAWPRGGLGPPKEPAETASRSEGNVASMT